MKNASSLSRRTLFKSSIFGVLSLSIPNLIFSGASSSIIPGIPSGPGENHKYPSTPDELVMEVVGKSHFDLDRVRELVNHRPELAKANWDWSFGDWESALGAASHVGRRDIADFLMENGARPTLFTFAMYGNLTVVKAMIEAKPELQQFDGPHGISLLSHAKAGLRSRGISDVDKDKNLQLIDYLEEINEGKPAPIYLEMTDAEKEKYIGDYRYGEGEKDGFTVKTNMRKMLSLGKLGKSGGGLLQVKPNVFMYNGVTSVSIHFEVVNDKVISLTVKEPDLEIKAIKV